MRRRGFTLVIVCAVAIFSATAWFHRADNAASPIATTSKQPFSGESLYQLQSTWTTDTGRSMQLQDLAGGSTNILALVFTQCSGSCPVLVKELQILERGMPAELLQDTHFVLVTIDPQNDTIAALREYRRRMQLDSEHWILLRGDAASVRELAAVLGFNYAPTEAQQFSHSNIVTVLNRRGEIAHQQTGTGGDSVTLLAVLRESSKASN